MTQAKVQYLGERPQRRVQFPCPYVAKSEFQGEVLFEQKGSIVEMSEEWALQLTEAAPDFFCLVGETKAKPKSEPKES